MDSVRALLDTVVLHDTTRLTDTLWILQPHSWWRDTLPVVGALAVVVAAFLTAYFAHRFNKRLLRKRLEVDGYRRIEEPLRALNESVNSLAATAKVLSFAWTASQVRHSQTLNANTAQSHEASSATKNGQDVSWTVPYSAARRFSEAVREALTRLLQEYGRNEILFQHLYPGLRDLWAAVDSYLERVEKTLNRASESIDRDTGRPSPSTCGEISRDLLFLYDAGIEAALFVIDLNREFQNRFLADVSGHPIPHRTCSSRDAYIITSNGLKTASEAGAPTVKPRPDSPKPRGTA